ncbi:hypothetical protein ACO0QE_001676 [Hanseniaspora vineae]
MSRDSDEHLSSKQGISASQPEENKDAYSCLRCRKYKKKCSRDKPKCTTCNKLNKECFYPGRARRRRRCEIYAAESLASGSESDAKSQTDFKNASSSIIPPPTSDTSAIQEKKIKRSLTHAVDIASSAASFQDILPTRSTIPISNNTNQSNTTSHSSQLKEHQKQDYTAFPHNTSVPVALPGSFTPSNIMSPGSFSTPGMIEYLSNISNSKNITSPTSNGITSSITSPKLGVSPAIPITNGSTRFSISYGTNDNNHNGYNGLSNMPSFQNTQALLPTRSEHLSKNESHSANDNDQGRKVSLSSNPTSSLHSSAQIKRESSLVYCPVDKIPYSHAQGALEHDLHKPVSTPIKPSSIQIEGLTAVFKGGRYTNWPLEKGFDSKFKKIEHSLYHDFIDAYFQHNHKSYPMINKFEFLEKVSKIKDFSALDLSTSSEYDAVFLFMLYLIMAIGCTSLSRAKVLKPSENDLSEHFAYLGMKRFCDIMHLQNWDTIRCLILLGIYSFFEPKGISSWTIGGIINRITIGLGLNRELTVSKQKVIDPHTLEFRHRIFWSAYCFERLVHTSLGRISSLDDDDINVPLPVPICEEEVQDIQVTKMIISIRKMGGKIYNKVHSVKSANINKGKTESEKQMIIDSLGKELDTLFEKHKIQMREMQAKNKGLSSVSLAESRSNSSQSPSSSDSVRPDISFHNSELWLIMRYEQLQIMLYRPSKLFPTLPTATLTILGQVCLTSLKHTHMLFVKNMLPYNWITLFRTLTICNTMLFCLCQWCVDTVDCQIEIQQCTEILKHFGGKWVFATNCAKVFENISSSISEFSVGASTNEKMKQLNQELFGASNEYQDILDENNVDVFWLDDFFVK